MMKQKGNLLNIEKTNINNMEKVKIKATEAGKEYLKNNPPSNTATEVLKKTDGGKNEIEVENNNVVIYLTKHKLAEIVSEKK